MRWFILLVSLLCLACGDTIVGPDPNASPSPSPTPDPCVPIRADIVMQVKGRSVFAAGIGDIITFTAVLRFREDDPKLTSECPQLDSVSWRFLHNGDPICGMLGNSDANNVKAICESAGLSGIVQAQPQGYDVDNATFTFRIFPNEAQ